MKFVSPVACGPAAMHLLIGLAFTMPLTCVQAQGVPNAPVVTPAPAKAKPLSVAQIDTLVEKAMKAFDVPGISVAVVKDGKVLVAKGYGLRSIASDEKMDAHTRVGIASNSKAFTAAALAILVDAGKLKWDDRVTDFIPEFKLYNPYVTEEFTVRDLLTHRSGLGLGAGDLMFFPYGSDFTTKDVIHNLRYLKQVSSFRSQYDYDNNLYIVAGEVVKRVSGIAFEQFVEQKILGPLAMNDSAASLGRLKSKDNIITPHVSIEGRLQVMTDAPSAIINAAGGLYSSANDMAKWVTMLLAKGKYGPTAERLLSEDAIKQMWSPQTILPVHAPGSYNTHFAAYGLGWFMNDALGYKQLTHTGGLMGMVTQVTLVPELGLGIVVLTNQQEGAAFSSISNTIKDGYFGAPAMDRIKQSLDLKQARLGDADKVTAPVWAAIDARQASGGLAQADLAPFVGTYRDKWMGDVVIKLDQGRLNFRAQRSPKLTGDMFFYKGNTFVVKWKDRMLEADAFVNFSLDTNGLPDAITMKAVSPLTDFSFDFHDLDLRRVTP